MCLVLIALVAVSKSALYGSTHKADYVDAVIMLSFPRCCSENLVSIGCGSRIWS